MTEIQNIPISQIIPGDNDRQKFDQAALEELAASIQAHGLAQPITVRPMVSCTECGAYVPASDVPEFCPNCGNDMWSPASFQIVAGERRFRAVRDVLKAEIIPCIVRELDDEAASAIMLAENMARQDLDPVDEAGAYQARMDTFGWSVQDCASKAGVSTIRVLFRLKLLRLRPDLQRLVGNGQLPLGYAQILADGDLDRNRQLLAISHLQANSSPTPPWFRSVVGKLKAEQEQESLFDVGQFTLASPAAPVAPTMEQLPPHPNTTTPPAKGNTLRAIVTAQVDFWKQAAGAWDALGKPFKRQECEAAATALDLALCAI